jgi:hypothetical protein
MLRWPHVVAAKRCRGTTSDTVGRVIDTVRRPAAAALIPGHDNPTGRLESSSAVAGPASEARVGPTRDPLVLEQGSNGEGLGMVHQLSSSGAASGTCNAAGRCADAPVLARTRLAAG